MQKVAIEISEKQYEKLEAIARWKSHQEGRTVNVEELIRIAVERHMERLYGKQKNGTIKRRRQPEHRLFSSWEKNLMKGGMPTEREGIPCHVKCCILRGTLFFEIARVAGEKRPDNLLLENVPGLLSHNKGETFHTILCTLSDLGYHVEWQVLNSKDFGVPQSRKRVYLVGYLDERCAGKILPFTGTNRASLIQVLPGCQGSRVYSTEGVSCTLTSGAGGMGGKTGLYEVGVPIKENTKKGYKMAYEGDSIDLAYAQQNTRRGRVGYRIAHTLTAESTQGTVHFVDLDHRLRVTEEARCLTTRQDEIGGRHLGERSGALEETGRADVYPDSDRPSWDLL